MNALATIRKYAATSLTKGAPIVTGNLRVGGTGGGNLGDWLSSNSPGNIYSSGGRGTAVWVPGTRIDWDRVTGDILSCPASRACLNWKARNRPQAPPTIEQSVMNAGAQEWRSVDHPFRRKLVRPNPLYDGDTLLNQVSFSLDSCGNAYIVTEFTKGGDLAEIYWWPHNWVTIPPEYSDFVESYVLRDRLGRFKEIDAQFVWHLKWGLDPEDWRFGLSPVAATKRGIYSLQQSSTYRANIFRNLGVAGRIVSSKDPNVTPDPHLVKKVLDDATLGDNAGSTVVLDFPADINYPQVTPQSMAIDTVDDRPEADICACFGLPPQVVGLHVGRLSKTYANVKEARESAWEECIMPENLMLARQMGFRALPIYADSDDPAVIERYLDEFRLGFDYRAVRPLQPDLDALHKRARDDWKLNLLTLGEWSQAVGRPEPAPDVRDLRYRDLATVTAPEEPRDEDEDKDEEDASKGMQWNLRHLAELDAIDALEALHGKSSFTGNGVH